MAEHVHAFTVDLEEWFHGIELAPASWPTTSRLRVGLDRLVTLLDNAGVRATFFVLGAVARSHPEVVRELAEAGHEIASHGDVHEFVYRQTPEVFRDDLARSADAIHAVIGQRPYGYRAPYFSITSESLWALDVLAAEGYSFDSSVFPVRNPRYGIVTAPTRPFGHGGDTSTLTEIPLVPLQLFGRRLPFSGGAYLRILPELVQRAAWSLQGRRQSLVAYIHPWELDPEHPRIDLPRRVAATHYANLGATERRLRRLLNRHEFGSVSRVFL
jgi:polysaccharide deacetylase family protein (PEP-CTERM system associated)